VGPEAAVRRAHEEEEDPNRWGPPCRRERRGGRAERAERDSWAGWTGLRGEELGREKKRKKEGLGRMGWKPRE
jgi:hypothetical protein